jgi:hypothetical protein
MGRRHLIPCVTEMRTTKWTKMKTMKVKMTMMRKAKKKLREKMEEMKTILRLLPACFRVPLVYIPLSPPSHLLKANAKNIPKI